MVVIKMLQAKTRATSIIPKLLLIPHPATLTPHPPPPPSPHASPSTLPSHDDHGEEVEVEERLEELKVGGDTAAKLTPQSLQVTFPELHKLDQVPEGPAHLGRGGGRGQRSDTGHKGYISTLWLEGEKQNGKCMTG